MHFDDEALEWVRDALHARDSELDEMQMLKRFTKQYLLVLDEVGTGSGSDPEREMLVELIDLRYRAEKQTVLITNLNRQRLAECIGERAIDRLRENGEWVPMNWKSARGEDTQAPRHLKAVAQDKLEEREPRRLVL